MSAAIDVRGVSKRYRLYTERRDSIRERLVSLRGSRHEEFWALRDVSFEVEAGKTFGLIGQNGSGKSTLLKLIAGIHQPTQGTVTTGGRIAALLELGAGFHPDLTGRENVHLSAAILGLSRRYIDSRMDDIVEFSGVGQFLDSPVKVYSSGMAMRLGFAVATNVNPEILLVDEAISVGDEEFQRRCMDHVYRLRRAGTTIVFVSHSLGLVSDLCDSALWLDGGRIRDIGNTDTVIANYLHDVNSSSEHTELVEPGDDVETPAPSTRPGSGEVRISNVEFLRADGTTPGSLLAGEPCRVRIDYEARESMDDITFGLAFATESGTQVAGPNSGMGDQAVRVEPGVGRVEFVVDELLLQPSQYLVSAAVVTRLHIIDYIDSGYELPVLATAAVTEPGLVRMLGRWERMS